MISEHLIWEMENVCSKLDEAISSEGEIACKRLAANAQHQLTELIDAAKSANVIDAENRARYRVKVVLADGEVLRGEGHDMDSVIRQRLYYGKSLDIMGDLRDANGRKVAVPLTSVKMIVSEEKENDADD